ncbi:MAG: Spo0E like sporulation regulatory protein [Firmicutes bacterium]|nr:Spo0E like sporulation regulatory protein [Bacillota bacterium]
MSELIEIQQQIEELRQALNKLVVGPKGISGANDNDAASVSAQLDRLIVRYERLKITDEGKMKSAKRLSSLKKEWISTN